jgi:protein phosphatase
VAGSTAYVTNVGDCRTYLYREPDGLCQVTRDHSIATRLVEAGITTPDDIDTHPERNQVYSTLGEEALVQVNILTVPLQAGDKLLLCSDGLWATVRDSNIQRMMHAPVADPSETVKALIGAALKHGGKDNVSVIVVFVSC